MPRLWISAVAAIALGVCAAASAQQVAPQTSTAVYAPPQLPPRNETPEARRARWEAWRAANVDVDARIATFLRDTEAQVSAYRNRPPVDRFAELRAGVTAASRRQALTYFASAFAVWQAGDFAAAEIGFRRGLEIDPSNAPANFYMGDLLRRSGDSSGAREYFERSVAFGAGSSEALRAEAALAQLPAGGDPAINDPPTIWDATSRPSLLWDAPDAPEMIVIPAGSYTVHAERGGHRVTLSRPIAVSRFEVTRTQFFAFAAATNRPPTSNCRYLRQGAWTQDRNRTWRDPGFNQTDDHPIVCVTWEDAQAYAAWLSQSTGNTYRLISDAEWKYVEPAGTTSAYPWGGSASHENANYSGLAQRDQWVTTAPVGSFPASAFGLYDMNGNVWEWTQDCVLANEADACMTRGARGGSWEGPDDQLRSLSNVPSFFYSYAVGFRVVRTL